MAEIIEPYKAHYTDGYGDPWVFEYSPDDGRGTIRGQDVDWEPYLVLRGVAPVLELSWEDRTWLWRSWRQAIKTHGDPGIYGEEFPGRTSKQGPVEDFCPLCLRYRTEFEGHHVVWRMDGGSDHWKNISPICKSCHALTSHGDGEDSTRRDRAAFHHQAAQFGAAFFYNASFKKRDSEELSEERVTFQSLWPDRVKGQSRPTRLEQGRMLRNWHEGLYIYWRDRALERLPPPA